jgi:hypothetical protein
VLFLLQEFAVFPMKPLQNAIGVLALIAKRDSLFTGKLGVDNEAEAGA